ncbi:MAG: ComF family protein [Hormoscilla sp. GM7CHS1pb]|nr:ComF family protein [Hormoscilla sp. GM7CHS1pb]
MGSPTQWVKSFLNLFLKSNCPLCGRPADRELCPSCERSLLRCQFTNERCARGSAPRVHRSQFWEGQLPVFVWGRYGGLLKQAIAALKYENQPQLARPLGTWLAGAWMKSPHSQVKPVVVPIPLHADKRLARGFNQAELLAESFCQYTGLPLNRQGLERVRATEALFGLSLTERQQILADALSVGKSLTQKRPQRVLLLDDIYTTGTTVGEAARVLRRQGISVYGVVAIATTNKSPGSGS